MTMSMFCSSFTALGSSLSGKLQDRFFPEVIGLYSPEYIIAMFIRVKKLLEVTARSIEPKATIYGPMCANVEGTGVSFVLLLVLSLSLVIDSLD
jgi:hypothetical protein